MMNYRTIPIWNAVPEMPYFQFPWRLLILTTFVSPLFLIPLGNLKYAKQLSLGLIVLIIGINAFQFRPHDFLGRTDSYYLNRYVPFPDASHDYDLTQEEYLRLPKNTQRRPDMLYRPIFYFGDQVVSINTLKNTPFNYEAKLGINPSGQVSFNKYLFPGWLVMVDGNLTSSSVGQPFGQINFPLSAGFHEVRVFFQETLANRFFDSISFLALIISVLLLKTDVFKRMGTV